MWTFCSKIAQRWSIAFSLYFYRYLWPFCLHHQRISFFFLCFFECQHLNFLNFFFLLVESAINFVEQLNWDQTCIHLKSPSLILGNLLDSITRAHHLPTCIIFSRLNWEGLTSRLQKDLLQDEQSNGPPLEVISKREEEDIPILQFVALHFAISFVSSVYCQRTKNLIQKMLSMKLFHQCSTLHSSFGLIFNGTFFQKLLIGFGSPNSVPSLDW